MLSYKEALQSGLGAQQGLCGLENLFLNILILILSFRKREIFLRLLSSECL